MYECKDLKVLAVSDKAGICILKRHNNRSFYFTGHAEYDRETLLTEYERDLAKGEPIKAPENYFVDEEKKEIKISIGQSSFFKNYLFSNVIADKVLWKNIYIFNLNVYFKISV